MDLDFRAFAVGPAASTELLRKQLGEVKEASYHELAPGSAWCVIPAETDARAAAERLPKPVYMFDVELLNGMDDEQAHSGTMVGLLFEAGEEPDQFALDSIFEEGLVRGPLKDAALEYLFSFIRRELLEEEDIPRSFSLALAAAAAKARNAAAASPEGEDDFADVLAGFDDVDDPTDEPNTDAQARHLIGALIESDQLVLVNELGRTTLVEPVAKILDLEHARSDTAEAIAEALIDAPEVVDLHASDDEIIAILAALP